MRMGRWSAAALAAASGAAWAAACGAAATAAPAVTAAANATLPEAARWWSDIALLAGDDTEGRLTGSSGFDLAAERVIARFKAEGLEPAADGGYRQPVAFERQVVAQGESSAELSAADGEIRPLRVGEELLIATGGAPRPDRVDAPLVFVGYGLHLPEFGEDDFAGLDIRNKIVVVLSGGPAEVPGAVKANARFARTEWLGRAGAAGVISLTTPKQVEIPWVRQKLLAAQSGMYLADATLRDTPDGFFIASIDPDASEAVFKGSGHTFAELCGLADRSAPLPRVALAESLRATIIAHREAASSPNLVAKLPGRDRKLASEFVAVSAHLDHLGSGAPIAGDRIYNGAMDDASGVASVLDIAHRLHGAKRRPRRSILFLIFTAEEKGLLGSHYFALRPTVPRGAIVADLNFDMPLPLWPLKSVIAQGAAESTLGADAEAIAAAQGITLVPDPLPDRNTFIRTDQFSFVREGIPALAFKFGFARDTPEFQIEHDWRATRYHSPSDDLDQPGVLPNEAVKLDAFVAALMLRVADADAKPQWLPTSIFKLGSGP